MSHLASLGGDKAEQLRYGNITAAILEARHYAKYPNETMSYREALESMGDDIVDAVHAEWAKMSPEAYQAHQELLGALDRQHWTPEDWQEYRQMLKRSHERAQAASDRMKQEAAQMTLSRQGLGLPSLRP